VIGAGDDPVPVRVGLERVFRHLGAPAVDVVIELGDRWSEIVGPVMAGPTRPAELVDGVLVVVCDDAAWVSQVRWMESQICRRLTAVFPGVELERITARLDR
jgi:predicted nucleic acid-binding Zn ribbon protein